MAAALLLCATPVRAETLADVLDRAWATNPELAAARARQEALAETPEQARAAGRLAAETSGSAGYDRLGYGRAGSIGVAARLPIWTGGRVGSAVRAANGDVAAGAEDLRDAEAAVLERVVSVYAAVLYDQQAVEVARVGIGRLDRQVEEARSRFRLGQATRTDVAQLEAQRSSVAANLADAEGSLDASRAAYRALVGQDPVALVADIPVAAAIPQTLASVRQVAEAANPRLLAQRNTAAAAAARIDQARADRAPSIGIEGGYGRGARVSDGGFRGFDAAGSAGLSLRLPLLTGGLVSSRVRQAEANWRAERSLTDATAREAVRSAETAWATLTAARVRVRTSAEGLGAADIALKGVRAEYGFGLRSTIDILVADQSYRSAQLDVARARADLLVAEAALLRAMGRLGPRAFG